MKLQDTEAKICWSKNDFCEGRVTTLPDGRHRFIADNGHSFAGCPAYGGILRVQMFSFAGSNDVYEILNIEPGTAPKVCYLTVAKWPQSEEDGEQAEAGLAKSVIHD